MVGWVNKQHGSDRLKITNKNSNWLFSYGTGLGHTSNIFAGENDYGFEVSWPAQFLSEDLLQSFQQRREAYPRRCLVQTPTRSADWSRPDRWPRSRRQGQGLTRTWTDASKVDRLQSCSHRQDDRSRPRGHGVPRDVDQAGRHRSTQRLQPTETHSDALLECVIYVSDW